MQKNTIFFKINLDYLKKKIPTLFVDFIKYELIYRVSFIWQFSSSVGHLHFLPRSLWCR